MTSEKDIQKAQDIIRYLIIGIEDGWLKPSRKVLKLYYIIKDLI